MTESSLTVEPASGYAILWLARPEKLNALDRALWEEIPAAVERLDADPAVRAIVLAGKGKAFCAGIDVADHVQIFGAAEASGGDDSSPVVRRRGLLELIRRYQRSVSAFALTNKPVIAAIQGACLGAGMDLITACDLRIAAADAVFSVRETRIAMVADVGTLQRLPRIVGDGAARELVFTGRDIDAARAREIGLVSEVLPDVTSLQARAREVAAEIAAHSPLAVQGAKQVLGFGQRREVDAGLDYVAAWNAAFMQSEDLGEAVRAFIERRKPEFRGR
jgi:enoyl-CoA hydratase